VPRIPGINHLDAVRALKKAMPNGLINTGTLLLVLLAVLLACVSGGNVNGGASKVDEPLVELLEGNFAQASYVFEIEVKDLREVATFRSDSGEVGYKQYSVTGTVLDVLKSSEEWEPFSREVEYRFTQEYDPAAGPRITTGGIYLVFLMLAGDPSRLWVIGNGAQFELNPELSETIGQIVVMK
jgi:hypothetical protein